MTTTAARPMPAREDSGGNRRRPAIVRFSALVRAEITLLRRNRMQLFTAILFPAVVPLLFIPLAESGEMHGPVLANVLATLLLMLLLFVVYFNLISAYVARREELVLKRLRVGELPGWAVLAATAVPALVVSVVMTVVLTAMSVLILDAPLPRDPLLVLAIMLAAAICLAVLALVTANITRSVESAQVTSLPFMAVAVIAGGIAIPLDAMPEAFQRLAGLVPTAPLRDVVLVAWLGVDADGTSLSRAAGWGGAVGAFALLAAWTVLGIALLSSTLKWEPRA